MVLRKDWLKVKNKFNKIVAWSLLLGTCVEAMPVWALSKDETVYAKLNNNGSVNSVIVSEHLGDINGNNITTSKFKRV